MAAQHVLILKSGNATKPVYIIKREKGMHKGTQKETSTKRRRCLSRIRCENVIADANSTADSEADISIPGMSKLFDSDYSIIGKFIWGAAIAACFVVCIMQITNRIAEYFMVPVDTNVKLDRNASISFPAITVCPFYPFRYSAKILKWRKIYAKKFKISYDNDDDLTQKVHSLDLLDLKTVSVNKLWKAAGIGNVTCEFQTRKNCTRHITQRNLETILGLCTMYALNMRVRFDGTYNGYEVFLEPEQNRPGIYWQSMITLHQTKDWPRHKVYLEGAQVVHPNFETTVTFEVKQYFRFPTSSRPCVGAKTYRLCFWNCLEEFMYKNVSCRLPYITNRSLPICTRSEEAKRTEAATKDAYRQLENGTICTHCPRKCVENVFSVRQDVTKPQQLTWLKVLIQDNLISVVEEHPSYSLYALVSEVGGSLGLFLGVCLLTALQLLEIIAVRLKKVRWCRIRSKMIHKFWARVKNIVTNLKTK